MKRNIINNPYKFFLKAVQRIIQESILSRRIGRNLSSVVANIEEIYQRSLLFFFFFRWRIVGFSIDIRSNSRFHQGRFIPVTILIESFRKHPSRVNFHPFAGLSPPIDWPSSWNPVPRTRLQKNRHPDKMADYRVRSSVENRENEIVDYQFSICIGIFSRLKYDRDKNLSVKVNIKIKC